MEQNNTIESLKTSLAANIWAERYNIVIFLITIFIATIARMSLLMFLKLFLITWLLTGTVAFGFIGVSAHIRYYFHFERNRTVKLYTDRMEIIMNGKLVGQIFKNDIAEIVLHDRLRSSGSNFYMTLLDSYYYLIVISKNQEKIILTCLLDVKLKKKIAFWYGRDFEHKYQFFPFPKNIDTVKLSR